MEAGVFTPLVTVSDMEIEGTSEMAGVAVTSWTVPDVDVGVGSDGDIWLGQCVNVLLLYSA